MRKRHAERKGTGLLAEGRARRRDHCAHKYPCAPQRSATRAAQKMLLGLKILKKWGVNFDGRGAVGVWPAAKWLGRAAIEICVPAPDRRKAHKCNRPQVLKTDAKPTCARPYGPPHAHVTVREDCSSDRVLAFLESDAALALFGWKHFLRRV